MTTHLAAKLARPTEVGITHTRMDLAGSLATTAAPSLPAVALASLAMHGLIGLALIGLPLTTSVARELDATWVSFDFEVAPAAAPEIAPEPEVAPEPIVAPEPVVRRERAPIAEPEPEIAPPPPDVIAPPSLEEAFAEPAPLAASLTADGTGGFAVAQGELGGDPNGHIGGHGTSLVSTVRPTPHEAGPSDADRRRARRGYVHAIEDLVRAHARYPRAAAREGLQGRVELGLRVTPEGRVLALRVATSSGSSILDEAALAAGREIDRVPAPPALASLAPTDEIRVGVAYLVH